jgi:hypothetical protein
MNYEILLPPTSGALGQMRLCGLISFQNYSVIELMNTHSSSNLGYEKACGYLDLSSVFLDALVVYSDS